MRGSVRTPKDSKKLEKLGGTGVKLVTTPKPEILYSCSYRPHRSKHAIVPIEALQCMRNPSADRILERLTQVSASIERRVAKKYGRCDPFSLAFVRFGEIEDGLRELKLAG